MLARLAAATIFTTLSIAASAKPATLAGETNLRAAPGTKSEIVTLMPKGETVEVGACDAGWCEVAWNEKKGFAIARNLGLAPPAPRRVARRTAPPQYGAPPGYYDDDDYEDAGPPVYYAPGPYVVPAPFYYGPGPYWGWRGGYRHHWRRW